MYPPPVAGRSVALDQLDLVAGGILDERDHGLAMFHRSWLTHDPVAERSHPIACGLDVVGADRDVSERIAKGVVRVVPVVRELEDRVRVLVSVPHEAECELPLR